MVKSILKCKKETIIKDDGIFTKAIALAKAVKDMKEMSFKNFLKNLSVEQMNGLKFKLEHGKQQNSKKLEEVIEFDNEFKTMLMVKDFLEESIAHARNLLHDGIVKECSGEGNFKMSKAVNLVEIAKGKKEDVVMS